MYIPPFIGALYKDDTGIHASKDGEYRAKENIPADYKS